MHSINPATGAFLREFQEPDDSMLNAMVQKAYQCYGTYRRTTFTDRSAMMSRAAAVLRSRTKDFAKIMTAEMGKPIAASEAEVDKCAWVCDYYAEYAEQFLTPIDVQTEASVSRIMFQPIGPVLAIMPWNFPFWQVFRFAVPALMAGNVGLLKHASNVPASALAIEEVLRDAGFPDGAFQTLLIGSGRVAELIADTRIAGVTLTGSEGAGRIVGETAGRNLKKVVLELGGSDPFIIMPDSDLTRAIATAVTARTINNGQSCIAAKRFIVHNEIRDEFEQEFTKAFRALRIGDPMDPATQIGPLARPEFVDDLHSQVESSIQHGARLLTGGRRLGGAGYYYEPTILTDVRPGMSVYHEETFGPVAAVIGVQDIDEAIAVANDTPFGLGASAWTNRPEEQQRFLLELEAGSVFINDMVKSDPRLPFGGIKTSGVGRELGEFGIREFVNIKTVVIH